MASRTLHGDLATGMVHDHAALDGTVAMSEGQARAFGLRECPDCFGGEA